MGARAPLPALPQTVHYCRTLLARSDSIRWGRFTTATPTVSSRLVNHKVWAAVGAEIGALQVLFLFTTSRMVSLSRK